MDYLFQDGGKTKKSTKKTSSKKGGNFLGAVGDLVAPTGWGPFATAAGLLALDRADAALRRGKSVKSSTKKGGQSKTSSKKTSSKKGGNFLGSVGELVAPTGWESFATTAGLFALDRADAALRRGKSVKNSSKKGGQSKTSSKKGGNFLGSVGELVAPTGWESFATTAGLFALDRADAALRRGKSSAKKGGMRGGNEFDDEAKRILMNDNELHIMFKTLYKYAYSSKISDQNATGAYCEEIDNFIEKEIENRNNLIKGMSDEKLKEEIKRSITELESLQLIGTFNPSSFRNYSNLSKNQSKITEYYEIFKRLYRKPKYTGNT